MKSATEIIASLKRFEELPNLEAFRVCGHFCIGNLKELLDNAMTKIYSPSVQVIQQMLPSESILFTDRLHRDLEEFLVTESGDLNVSAAELLAIAGYKVAAGTLTVSRFGEEMLVIQTGKGPIACPVSHESWRKNCLKPGLYDDLPPDSYF